MPINRERNTYNINAVKLVFCDFDDTACIHLHMNVKAITSKEWNKLNREDRENTYTDIAPCEPNYALSWFLQEYLSGVEKKILTWHAMTGLVKARKVFCDKYYPGEFNDVVLLSRRECKIPYLIAEAERMHLKRSEILLIEDHPETLNEARKAGFPAINIGEIDSMYIRKLHVHQS